MEIKLCGFSLCILDFAIHNQEEKHFLQGPKRECVPAKEGLFRTPEGVLPNFLYKISLWYCLMYLDTTENFVLMFSVSYDYFGHLGGFHSVWWTLPNFSLSSGK